jgi:hypothetical protein
MLSTLSEDDERLIAAALPALERLGPVPTSRQAVGGIA